MSKREIVTDATCDDVVETGGSPVKRAKTARAGPRALKPLTAEQQSTLNAAFGALPGNAYAEKGYPERTKWELVGSRLVSKFEADDRNASLSTGYVTGVKFFYAQGDDGESLAGKPLKMSGQISAMYDDVMMALQDPDVYAASSNNVKFLADMHVVWVQKLKTALCDSEVIKKMLMKKDLTALEKSCKKKSLETKFDEDNNRDTGRPNLFSLPIGHKYVSTGTGDDAKEDHLLVFKFNLYLQIQV